VGFGITDQLLVRFFCIRQILEKKWEYNETVHQLLMDFKKACGSQEVSIVQYSHRVWGILETSQVN
jgi:hypothetical protein